MNKQILVTLVAILVMVFAVSSVSAFDANIDGIRVNNVEALNNAVDLGTFAGQTITVQTTFTAEDNASDVSMTVRIAGSGGDSVSTERFDVYDGSTYTRFAVLQLPSDIDPTEDLKLYVTIENDNGGIAAQEAVTLKAQRESYKVEILDVNMDSKVEAGSNVALNIVLKNRGSHLAEDTFVRASIPSLGVEERSYFGDMSSVDQSNPDKEDAVERRLYISIPSNAAPGVYTLEVEAFNGDSSTVVTKKVLVTGASEDSMVVSSSSSKSFAVGEKAAYTITLVNSGSKIKVYELVADSTNNNVNVEVDSSVVAVPAGSSETVKVYVTADKAGRYDFSVDVLSNGDLVEKKEFSANVGSSTGKAFSGNTAVVLTVVLAIIFVVLLVVLIVLLTRKPQKTQEFGESYY